MHVYEEHRFPVYAWLPPLQLELGKCKQLQWKSEIRQIDYIKKLLCTHVTLPSLVTESWHKVSGIPLKVPNSFVACL